MTMSETKRTPGHIEREISPDFIVRSCGWIISTPQSKAQDAERSPEDKAMIERITKDTMEKIEKTLCR